MKCTSCTGKYKVKVKNELEYGTQWEDNCCSAYNDFSITYVCDKCGFMLEHYNTEYKRLTDLPKDESDLEKFLQKIIDERK
jgi:hypothetical protein